MIIRSLPRPSILRLCCFTTTRNLSFNSSSVRPFFPLRPNPSAGGCSCFLISTHPTDQPFIYNNHPILQFGSLISVLCRVRSVKLKNRSTTHLAIQSMSSSPTALTEKAVDNLLTATEDDHGGVIVEMTTGPLEPSVFASLLRASLSHWKQQGKKGIWIKVPIELVNLVESAVKEGFYYHHAEPKYLMLVYWIPETANTLPVNASHRVGIGAFVMKENGEVLVVQEKSGKFRGSGIWKFPTGVVDEGEDICDAAVREVKEETGINAKFVEILGFRQSHKSFFEKSDLFFMCMLQPLSFDIQKQESEIEAAEWMSFEKYAAQPFVQKHELLKYIVDICAAKRDKKYSGFSPVPTVSSFSNEKSFLYLNRQSLNPS